MIPALASIHLPGSWHCFLQKHRRSKKKNLAGRQIQVLTCSCKARLISQNLRPAHGTPIEPRNFSRSFDRRVEKAHVSKITVHGTRKTCGSLLATLDVHPRVAMQILRHSKIAVTMEIYTQIPSAATRKQASTCPPGTWRLHERGRQYPLWPGRA